MKLMMSGSPGPQAEECAECRHCPLFARKFKAEAKEKAADVLHELRIVLKP